MSSEKSKTIVLFLCIFLGVLGAHRLYVGKAGTGLLFLITLGGLGIGVIADIILILRNRFYDKHGCAVDIWNPGRMED